MKQQLVLDIFHSAPQTLHNFAGSQNSSVIKALRTHAQPGRAIYIWGDSGSGRSHLLNAITQNPGSLYIEAHNAAVAINNITSGNSVNHHLIAVDNVHKLDANGQASLFNLYNRWREAGSMPHGFTIVVSGNNAPMAMPLREDLRTRLGWDLTFRLHTLSDDERIQAISKRAEDTGIKLTNEVLKWLLTYYSRDMRHLNALIDALDRYSIQRHRAITVPLLKELLADSDLRRTN